MRNEAVLPALADRRHISVKAGNEFKRLVGGLAQCVLRVDAYLGGKPASGFERRRRTAVEAERYLL